MLPLRAQRYRRINVEGRDVQNMPKKETLLAGLTTAQPSIAKLAGMDGAGQFLVNIPGRARTSARLVAGLDRDLLVEGAQRGREVLVVFAEGDAGSPIIVALMDEPLAGLLDLDPRTDKPEAQREISIDGKRVVIEAEHEVVLKCGKSSITLRQDGKIVIKGTDVLSRSSGMNRIKGGAVGIN